MMKELGLVILTCFFLSSVELAGKNVKVLIILERKTAEKEIVLKQLASENASSTCQALLRLVRSKGSLWTYIQTCQEVGTSFMQGVALATALRGETAAQVIQGMRKKRLTLMETFLQIKCVSLVAKWGIFASNVLASRDNKLCKDILPLMPEWVSLGKRL